MASFLVIGLLLGGLCSSGASVNVDARSEHDITRDSENSTSSRTIIPRDDGDVVSALTFVADALRFTGLEVTDAGNSGVSVSARMKMSDIMFNPVMLVPQLILWGFAPIILANLKMFVMQALMLNKMALSSAIWLTLRNIVFGARPGPLVKYHNYGYSHGQNNFQHYHNHRKS